MSEQFEVGDKVECRRIEKNWKFYGEVLDDYLGKTLTIDYIYDDDGTVVFKEGGCMPPNWLRLIEKAKKPEKKERKGIRITYVEGLNTVTITAIRGLLSPSDIRRRFGVGVLDKYRRSDAYIAKWLGDMNSVNCGHGVEPIHPLPATLPKRSFAEFLAYAKKAGDNLHRIVAEERKREEEPTEKTIII